MDQDKRKETDIVDYAWKWFDFHARQRQTNIQFSITLLSATLAAVGYLLVAETYFLSLVASAFGLVGCIVFYGVDQRNSFLVKLAERELGKFEDSYSRDHRELAILNAADDPSRFMIKYSRAAVLIYSGYAFVYAIALLASLYSLAHQ